MLGNTEVKSKVAVLEQRSDYQEHLIQKVDAAIQVMKDAVENVSKMLAVHNEKLEQHNKTETLMIEMIREVKENLEAEDVDLSDRIDAVDTKIEDLKKFKWIAVGVGLAAGFIVTTVVSLASGILTGENIQSRMDNQPANIR
jgi:tetrahydromethanopterin S-methyltransferase subunit F